MGSAFYGVDVVDVRIDLLREAVVVGKRDVDRNHLVVLHADCLRNQLCGTGIKIIDEFLETLAGVEYILAELLLPGGLGIPVLIHLEDIHEFPFICQDNLYALVQIGEFPHPVCQGVILVDNRLGEYLGIRVEGDDGSGVIAVTCNLDRSKRLAFRIFLHEDVALAMDLGDERVRKGIDAGDTDSMQTSGNFVGVLVELSSRMKHGHDDFQGGTVLLGVHAGRNSSAIVGHTYGVILKDRDGNGIAISGHGLIDTIVNYLIHKMMETSFTNVSYVH